ncbi:MAG TPA: hypothetical protein VNG13_03270 [Mycobacteriales bacterium]|nr:hypothetical protein [Mycobacteriales bacterium]
MTDGPVVAVPADLAVRDRLTTWCTLGQAGHLSVAAAGLALATAGPRAALVPGVLLALAAVGGGWLRPQGRSLAGWVGPCLGFLRRRVTG